MPIRLDGRLSLIASLVDYGSVADIGCDHGKLSYYLISTDRADRVIATDISAPSLKKASELALANGADIDVRLGDGLAPVSDGEVDTVIIAGLGGDVISAILERARQDGKRFSHYILSPNTHPEKVRRELEASGHRIVYDRLLECGGKIYTVIKSELKNDAAYSALNEYQTLFGAFYCEDELAIKLIKEELVMKENLLISSPDSQSLASRVELLKKALASINED